MSTYLIDSNVFIQAKNFHYRLDSCPAFWDWLVEQNDADTVASIEKVLEELKDGDDELAKWAIARGDKFFLSPDEVVLRALRKVNDWAYDKYPEAAVKTFLEVADSWLVAHALAHNCIVVTHEKPFKPQGKIKIPDACAGLNIECMNPFEMLRREHAKFVLGTGREAT